MKKYSLNDPLTFFEKTAIFELNPKAVPLTIFKSKREAKVLKIIHPLGILMAISAFLPTIYLKQSAELNPRRIS